MRYGVSSEGTERGQGEQETVQLWNGEEEEIVMGNKVDKGAEDKTLTHLTI
jgi:hypothetical protein